MNKIMIVGHPTSEYQGVEALLVKCGMAPALSSRREGLTPAEISSMLLKAHPSSDRAVLGSVRSLPQVEAGPIWHGMALDLMLGNIEQKLWGWADPHAVQLLEYWKNLDPSIAFVLVYDSPESLLVRSIESGNDFNLLEAMVAEWCAYNEALLHFFYRNAERSLLVHAQQVRASASGYLQQVQARINAPMKSLLEVPGNDTASHGPQYDLEIPGNAFSNLLSSKTDTGAVKRYLAKAIVCEYPDSEQLYEELQTAANLPLVVSVGGSGLVHGAWRELVAIESTEATHRVALETQESEFAGRIEELQASMRAMHEKLGKVQDESLAQLKKLHETQEQSELYRNDLLEESTRSSQLLSLSEDRKKKLDKLEKELEDQKLVASTAQQKLTKLTDGHSKDGARVVQLENDLDALTKESANFRVQRREMEAALLGVQEELERSHIELRKALEKNNSNSAEQSQAGEQLKLANQHKSKAEARVAELESDRIALEKRNGSLQREISALVDRIQRMQEEWEGRKASSSATTTKRQDHYGAADRVRRQLSYRLGATMIKHSYSVGGWLTMPIGLAKEAKRFRMERRQRGKEKLPSIVLYRDAQEADRMRRHLSYRLGSKMLGNATSPLGWLRMPFILRKEVTAFREEKRNKQ